MPALILVSLTLHGNRCFGKDSRGVKQRAVVFTAVEAVADPDAIGATCRLKPHATAETFARMNLHNASLARVRHGRRKPPMKLQAVALASA